MVVWATPVCPPLTQVTLSLILYRQLTEWPPFGHVRSAEPTAVPLSAPNSWRWWVHAVRSNLALLSPAVVEGEVVIMRVPDLWPNYEDLGRATLGGCLFGAAYERRECPHGQLGTPRSIHLGVSARW